MMACGALECGIAADRNAASFLRDPGAAGGNKSCVPGMVDDHGLERRDLVIVDRFHDRLERVTPQPGRFPVRGRADTPQADRR
ncbi:hypothetical protein D3C72_1790620 [compost metagenome]